MRNLTAILCGMTMLGSAGLVLAATDDMSNSTSGVPVLRRKLTKVTVW